jgi:hypothetical protein
VLIETFDDKTLTKRNDEIALTNEILGYGCIGKKCQERRRLAIIHVKGVAFCLLMSLLFFVFCCLQVMKFNVLFFMEC